VVAPKHRGGIIAQSRLFGDFTFPTHVAEIIRAFGDWLPYAKHPSENLGPSKQAGFPARFSAESLQPC
jgi:hypothetical protein